MSTQLKEELEFFTEIRNELWGNSPGKFALIKGKELLGVFESQTDALFEGWKRLANVPFLVKKITQYDDAMFFTSHLLGV